MTGMLSGYALIVLACSALMLLGASRDNTRFGGIAFITCLGLIVASIYILYGIAGGAGCAL